MPVLSTERPSDRRPPSDPVAREVVREREVVRQRSSWTARLGLLVVVALALVGIVALGGRLVGLPDLNPFDARTTDRSQPPVLQSIQDLDRYSAAQGNFEVVVDVQHDRDHVPDFLLNERTLFVAAGSVESYVDFSSIGKGAVTVTGTGADRVVRIALPEPTLGDPSLDMKRSYVYESQRGLVNRAQDAFGSGTDRSALYRTAESKLAKAAVRTDLVKRAEQNTTKMLNGLLRSLGYDDVRVTYAG